MSNVWVHYPGNLKNNWQFKAFVNWLCESFYKLSVIHVNEYAESIIVQFVINHINNIQLFGGCKRLSSMTGTNVLPNFILSFLALYKLCKNILRCHTHFIVMTITVIFFVRTYKQKEYIIFLILVCYSRLNYVSGIP